MARPGRQVSRAFHWVLAVILLAGTGSLGGDIAREAASPATPRPGADLQISAEDLTLNHAGQVSITTSPELPGQEIQVTVLSPGQSRPVLANRDGNFFGISGVQIPWLAPQNREDEMILASAAGAGIIGLDFDWASIEPAQGVFDWKATDEAVRLARKYQMKLAPMLIYTPRWASSLPYAVLDSRLAPPVDDDLYRDFVYAVVNRYKPHGILPDTWDGWGITDWVIWNEPNVQVDGAAPLPAKFWYGSMTAYIRLLRAGYDGAHAADPGCNVLNGGLADVYWRPGQADLLSAVDRLYDPNGDGNADDGGRPFFDTLNIHIYQMGQPTAQWYQERIEAVQRVMQRFGDADKKIWVTETGYGSYSTAEVPDQAALLSSGLIDESQQASAVPLVYETLSAFPQVERVFWWSLQDYYGDNSLENPAMEAHYGLLHDDFLPKPAYLSYAGLTGSLEKTYSTTVTTDQAGKAQVNIPAEALAKPGRYLFIAGPVVPGDAFFNQQASAKAFMYRAGILNKEIKP